MPAQSLLIFAIAHMVETVVFNAVLLFNDTTEAGTTGLTLAQTSQNNSNLFKRAARLNASGLNESQLGTYAEAIVEFKDAVSVVFDTNEGSMLYETLTGLKMQVAALGRIANLPKAVIRQLENSLSTIQSAASEGANDPNAGGPTTEAAAMREQLNQKIVTEVNTNVSNYLNKLDKATLTDAEKEDAEKMCAATEKLAEGLKNVKSPAKCAEY